MSDPVPTVTESERRRVSELLSALRTPLDAVIAPTSAIMTERFVDEFQSRLLAQHVFLGNPLYQDSFDRAFIAAAEIAGFAVSEAPKGQRFWDVSLDGKKISLKSTKARSLSRNSLHFSKLTEAAWIQDCRTAKHRHERTLGLFANYCDEVDEIVQLRYFETEATYELVGIPVALFRQILDLPISEFQADGPSIKIPVGKTPPDFTLKLDRSDAKITIANILTVNCTIHGRWILPLTP